MTNVKAASARFTTATLLFVSSAATSYVLLDIAGVNLPRYYPVLHTWSSGTIEGAISMGLFGRFTAALLVAIVITLGYLIVSPLLARAGVVRTFAFVVKTNVLVWLAAAVIVIEEWHTWGIAKRGLEGGGLWNAEAALFGVGLAIALLGALVTALAFLRVSRVEAARKAKALNGQPTNDQSSSNV